MVQLKKINIQTQLFAAFLFITALLGIIGGIVFSAVKDIQAKTDEMVVLQNQLSRAQTIMWFDEILTQSLRNYILTGQPVWQKRYDKYAPQLDDVIAAAANETKLDSEKAFFRRQKEVNDHLVTMETQASERVKANQTQQALQIIDGAEYAGWKQQYASIVSDYHRFSKSRVQIAQENIVKQIDKTVVVILITLSTTLLIGLIFSLVMAKRLSHPLKNMTEIAKIISSGNLVLATGYGNSTLEIEQLQNALNLLVEQFQKVIMTIKNTTHHVNLNSQTINESVERMLQGVTTQAVTSKQVSTAIEDVATKIQQNVNHAQQTERLAVQAASEAQESSAAMLEAVTAMQEIAKKLTVIEDIATQTHILSLNASLEAERAREHGYGFAVVAQEVRALALHSKEAAVEINQLVKNSMTTSEQAKTMLMRLLPDIQKTAELVQAISFASQEQSVGVEQINQAVQQLEQVSLQNSKTSQELSFTSDNLTQQAVQLKNAIAFFQVE